MAIQAFLSMHLKIPPASTHYQFQSHIHIFVALPLLKELISILDHSGCYNRVRGAEGSYKQQRNLLLSLEAASLRSRIDSDENARLGHRLEFLIIFPSAESSEVSFIKVLIPFIWAPHS